MNATKSKPVKPRRAFGVRRGTALPPPPKETDFDVATFKRMADDLASGRMPLNRTSITDPEGNGLRVVIRKTGMISYHVSYDVEDEDGVSRPFLKIGTPDSLKLEEARMIAKTIRGLAELGIDPVAGLHERLIKEILAKGLKWRP